MDWQKFAADRWHEMATYGAGLAATFGLGGGVGIVKFLKHMPAPYQDQPWRGAMFDWLQDMATNSRIGDRRTRTGKDVPAVAVLPEVPEPKPAPVDPETKPVA